MKFSTKRKIIIVFYIFIVVLIIGHQLYKIYYDSEVYILPEEYRSQSYEYNPQKLNERLIDLEKKQKEIIHLVNNIDLFPSDSSILKKFNAKMVHLENKIDELNKLTLGLRQAINLSNPEEILTIARIKDELVLLKNNISKDTEYLVERQNRLYNATIREIETSNSTTTLFIIVLIPLIANFIYSVWRNNKQKQ